MQVTTEFSQVPATAANRSAIKQVISQIATNGGTDLCGGLLGAVQTAAAAGPAAAAPVKSVFLFTDGEPTDGQYRTQAAIMPVLQSSLRSAATQGSAIKVRSLATAWCRLALRSTGGHPSLAVQACEYPAG